MSWLIGSKTDWASGTASEPVTKSFCMSMTMSAGAKGSDEGVASFWSDELIVVVEFKC